MAAFYHVQCVFLVARHKLPAAISTGHMKEAQEICSGLLSRCYGELTLAGIMIDVM